MMYVLILDELALIPKLIGTLLMKLISTLVWCALIMTLIGGY